MSWSRVKSMLLVLLLVANVILLGSLVQRVTRRNSLELRALQTAVSLLPQETELSLFLGLPTSFDAHSVPRDAERERAFAESLLGACTATDAGGGVYVYESGYGSIRFRAGGRMEGEVYGVHLRADETASAQYAKLLQRAGLRVVESDEQLVPDSALFICPFSDGLTITNARLEINQTDMGAAFSGRWWLSDEAPRTDVSLRRAELVLRLGEHLRADPTVGAVQRVEAVYYMQEQPGLPSVLVPAWHITLQNGEWLQSALTGDLLA